jgi:hypothetical protein
MDAQMTAVQNKNKIFSIIWPLLVFIDRKTLQGGFILNYAVEGKRKSFYP